VTNCVVIRDEGAKERFGARACEVCFSLFIVQAVQDRPDGSGMASSFCGLSGFCSFCGCVGSESLVYLP